MTTDHKRALLRDLAFLVAFSAALGWLLHALSPHKQAIGPEPIREER